MFAGVTVVTWVSHHASFVAGGIPDRLHEALPARPGNRQSHLRIVQAEDELASIGMALGAGWAGARSMTATAGPGISLMSEFIGLGYYAEMPAVVFNVERVGPLHRPAHAHPAGRHPDHRHSLPRRYPAPMYFPCSPRRVFFHGDRSLRPGRALPDPVFVMTDLDLGMNNWMAGAFEYPNNPSAAARC